MVRLLSRNYFVKRPLERFLALVRTQLASGLPEALVLLLV
jgi:hypothetical protein